MLRDRIYEQYGEECRIQQVRRTPRFESTLFVVDLMQGAKLTRLLGAISNSGHLTEQSGMDLLHPERLVFIYERLMLVAFALTQRPRAALLLGLGGGAMARHLAAFLPDCAVTVVERDPTIVELARRFFHIKREIIEADAQEVVARSRNAYDVILVDLYDGRGVSGVVPRFWQDCARALRPKGCLSVNWAAFVDDAVARVEAMQAQAAIGKSFFVGPRALAENVVQLLPTDEGVALADIAPRWRRFALSRRLPREDREVLKRSMMVAAFPKK